MGTLEGKVAVITDGATGIGLASANRFIEEGAFVFIFGRRQEALDAAVADLGPNARAVIAALAENLGFAPIKLGELSEGGLLVEARGNSWGQLIFKDLVKFDG